jgi:hypothetical protein
MKRMAILSCLLAVGCSSGSSSGPAPRGDGLAPPVQPAVSLMVFIYDRPGPGATGRQVETFNDPSPELIEKQARGLNWNDAQHVPQVNLGWAAKGPFSSFSVTGLLGSTNEGHAARANWVSSEDGRGVLRRSKPLKSLDEVVELLLLAHKQDEQKLKALQEWEVIGQ